jgi:hypothetical protein
VPPASNVILPFSAIDTGNDPPNVDTIFDEVIDEEYEADVYDIAIFVPVLIGAAFGSNVYPASNAIVITPADIVVILPRAFSLGLPPSRNMGDGGDVIKSNKLPTNEDVGMFDDGNCAV